MSSYVASRMASREAEKMLTPLLSSDDEYSTASDTDSDESSNEETVKQSPMQKLKSIAVYVGLGVGAISSAAAMVAVPSIAIFVMGGVTIANVPYSAIKERHIAKFPGGGLRQLNNKLREDANDLENEVDVLYQEIDLLEPEAERAAVVEEQLRDIADQQGANVQKLVDLVKENEIILAKMRENLRQRIGQDILSIVMKSDRDNDNRIDRKEAKTLALRIRIALQEYGVDFDSEKFVTVVQANPSVTGVIGIVEKLMHQKGNGGKDDESSDEDSCDEPNPMYDMFHMSATSSRDMSGSSLMMPDKMRRSRRPSSAEIKRRVSGKGAIKYAKESKVGGIAQSNTLLSDDSDEDSDDSESYTSEE